MIETKGLRYRHLTYPDLTIREGCTIFICGNSGCGKTTLLKLINGVLSPDEGQVLYHTRPVDSFPAAELRREILLCPQDVFLFDQTIFENFKMFYSYLGKPCPDETDIAHCLSLCLAPPAQDSQCNILSGGERQRVFLAILLSMRPKVLMLDEPTSALDDETAFALLRGLTAHLKEIGTTLLVVSHNKSLVAQFSEEVIQL